MLRYLGTGVRNYAETGIGLYPRGYWEIEIVVQGKIGPVCENQQVELFPASLWIFSPQVAHGWTGVAGEPSQVVVFHLDAIPASVGDAVGAKGWCRFDLNDHEIRRFQELGQRAEAEHANPTGASGLLAEVIEMELRWLVAQRQPASLDQAGRAQRLIDAGLAWYEEHLALSPSLEQVAVASHSSVAHWRRLCHQAYDCSPQVLFDRIRMRHVCYLLERGQLSQEAIAARCGFSSASALSRAFRRLQGVSPRAWLQQRGAARFKARID